MLRLAKKIVPYAIVLIVGGFLGWLIPSPIVQQQIMSYRGALLREDSSGYDFIAPLLACDIGSEEAFPEFAPLKSLLTTTVNQKVSTAQAQRISVYVRSLKGARWLEVNGADTYAPASLLKVFVMMAYYKEADDTDDPSLLKEQLAFEGSLNPSADTPGAVIPHLQSGKLYTIDQIITQMIVYSDNDALNTLVDHFDTQTLVAFEGIFKDLSIPSPVTQSESSLNFMSVQNYAMIFRVLYSSTYLSNRYSSKALTLLSQAQYKNGVVAGVPSGLVVAHKFGDAIVPATASTSAADELHDCGIVYYPNHPYLLCIMTEGQSFASLQQTIADLSVTTYHWLDGYYKSLPSSSVATSTPTH